MEKRLVINDLSKGTIVNAHAFNKDGKRALMAHCTFRGCGDPYRNWQATKEFVTNHDRSDTALSIDIIVPGYERQRGAQYRLAPSIVSQQAIFELFEDEQKESCNYTSIAHMEQDLRYRVKHNIKIIKPRTISPLFKRICEDAQNVNFNIFVYDSRALNKNIPFNVISILDKKNPICSLLHDKSIQQYPLRYFKADFLRWIAEPKREAYERQLKRKKSRAEFFELMKTKEENEKVYAGAQEKLLTNPANNKDEINKDFDRASTRLEGCARACGWLLFRDL
jgi:hypothetical protein